MKETGYN